MKLQKNWLTQAGLGASERRIGLVRLGKVRF